MSDEVEVRGVSKWCLNCGKWAFQCQCRSPLLYCDEESFVVWMERRASLKELPVPFSARRQEGEE